MAIKLLEISLFEKIMLKSAMLLGFGGYLRVSEFCVKNLDKKFLRRKDVKLKQTSDNVRYLEVNIRSSKCSQLKEVAIYIYPMNSELCPVAAMQKYLMLTSRIKKCLPEEPLFWLDYILVQCSSKRGYFPHRLKSKVLFSALLESRCPDISVQFRSLTRVNHAFG